MHERTHAHTLTLAHAHACTGVHSPRLTLGACMQYSNLYLVAVARDNINAASILLFLHKLREVFVHYFNELEEESLRDNFVIAYELLDEVR